MDHETTFQSCLRPCGGCTVPGLHRRRFVLGALGSAALAACSTAPSTPAPAASVPASASAAPTPIAGGRIDVHHHHSPPAWLAVARTRGIDALAMNWNVQKSLADMDAAGVQTALLSVTTPGVVFRDLDVAAGRRLARDCNEYAARLRGDHRGRFGFFAALPMLDTEGALQEIAYAIDTLGADGIGLLTSYGDTWLGDPRFFPIMEELNRRKLVVYTHPTAANCCTSLQRNVPPVMIEFGTDTTRAIASVLFDGNVQRFRDIRWIFSHAGGTMPFLVERFVRHPTLVPSVAPAFPDGVAAELRRFWYDTAQTANAAAMSALTKLVPVEQVVFGTDYPYRTSLDHVRGLRSSGLFTAEQLQLVERDTALRLLPRLRA